MKNKNVLGLKVAGSYLRFRIITQMIYNVYMLHCWHDLLDYNLVVLTILMGFVMNFDVLGRVGIAYARVWSPLPWPDV